MPADGVLAPDAVAERPTRTVRCWVRPRGEGDDVTGTWFDVVEGERLLHEMIKRGLCEIPVGCRGGGCGVCRVHVLDGHYRTKRMSRKHVTEADEAEGFALACRVIPTTDIVVELAPSTDRT